MVLINNLTIDEINAALLHLQRARTEVVGGTKGSTVQNITISNKGGGSTVDYAPTITALSNRVDKNTDAIESVEDKIDKIQTTLEQLSDNGISSMTFDPMTRQLQINTQDGEVYSCDITSENIILDFDATTNKLTLEMGEQYQEVTLPYINANEKGSANGVATLDENGRVPYSQLPESAMEFLGQWDASTNTPHLADGTGTNGDFYIVSVGGTVDFGTAQDPHIVTFTVNDRVVYEGDIAQWVRLPAGQVSSVNGQSGAVTLTASDIEYSTGVSIKAKIDANAVQADWNVSDTTSLAYIKNKPTIPASPVQSDWNVTDTTSLAYIKNKPTIPTGNIIKAVCANSYWGMADPSGADNVWIRTTTQGIIPYQSGGANAGHQSLGTASWYFADAYIQNIHGTTVSATTVTANGYQLKRYYELDLSSLSTSNFYPITFPATDLELDCEIHSPNLGGGAAYNQNYIHFKLIAQGWSDTPRRLVIEQYAVYDANEITIGSIGYGNRSGGNCVWVRGGMKYRFYSNQTPTLHSTNYTYDSQTYSVGTNKTGGTNANVTIAWEANGVNSATFSNVLYATCFCGTASCATHASCAVISGWSPQMIINDNVNYDVPFAVFSPASSSDRNVLGIGEGRGLRYNPSTCTLKTCYLEVSCGGIGWSIVQDCCEILIKKGFDNLYFICFSGNAKQCNIYKAICNIVHECYSAIPSTGESRWETGFIGYAIYDNNNGFCNCFYDIGTINLTSNGRVTFYSNADTSEFCACNTCSSAIGGRLTRGFFVL